MLACFQFKHKVHLLDSDSDDCQSLYPQFQQGNNGCKDLRGILRSFACIAKLKIMAMQIPVTIISMWLDSSLLLTDSMSVRMCAMSAFAAN